MRCPCCNSALADPSDLLARLNASWYLLDLLRRLIDAYPNAVPTYAVAACHLRKMLRPFSWGVVGVRGTGTYRLVKEFRARRENPTCPRCENAIDASIDLEGLLALLVSPAQHDILNCLVTSYPQGMVVGAYDYTEKVQRHNLRAALARVGWTVTYKVNGAYALKRL